MHQVHNCETDYAWQFKGNKGTKKVRTNTGRRRINIIGGINILTMRATTVITEINCDKTMVISFLEKLRKESGRGKHICLVLDNARYNRAEAVKQKAKELDIELVYLPPYCPNLNLIERLWKDAKKNIVKNKYYEKFDAFAESIDSFFTSLKDRVEELKILLSFKFGIIKAN